jgi:fatty-acyl-CoA synthase
VAQRLLEQYDLRYVEGYGLTETAAPSHANPPRCPQAAVPGHPVHQHGRSRVIDPDSFAGNAGGRGRRDRHPWP